MTTKGDGTALMAKKLYWVSTLSLALLTLITFGFYYIYYAWKQTKEINKLQDRQPLVSELPITILIALTLVGVVLSLANLVFQKESSLVSEFISYAVVFIQIYVAYSFAVALNTVFGTDAQGKSHFSVFLAVIFGFLHINHTLHTLSQRAE